MILGTDYSYRYRLQPIILIIGQITRITVISVQLNSVGLLDIAGNRARVFRVSNRLEVACLNRNKSHCLTLISFVNISDGS